MATLEQARNLQRAMRQPDDTTAERILAALEKPNAEYGALARENANQQRRIEQLERAIVKLQRQPPMVEAMSAHVDKRFNRMEKGLEKTLPGLVPKDVDFSALSGQIKGLFEQMTSYTDAVAGIKLPDMPKFPDMPAIPNHEGALSSIVATLDQLQAALTALGDVEAPAAPVYVFDVKRKGTMGLIDEVIARPA